MSLPRLRPVTPAPLRTTRSAAHDLLPDAPSADPRADLEARLQREVRSARIELGLTDNRSTMISVRSDPGLYRLRLHHMFLAAGPEIVLALARYVERDDRAASQILNHYIDRHATRIRRPRRSRSATRALQPRGEVHDLLALFDALNARYFAGAIRADITWGPRLSPALRGRERRSLKLGSYCVEDRLIRIHPSLDRSEVPVEFLGWIVYHEMLHQKHDIPVRGGRRQFHTPAFLAEEARYQHYEAARRWEREHLDLLLSY
jgi:hypothetical protein